MNKRMRELQEKIKQLHADAQTFMGEENKDLAKAEDCLNQADELQKEFDLLERAEKANKAAAQAVADTQPAPTEKADGFKAMAKKLNGQGMDEAEKALISGDGAENGENLLIPEDVKLEINELRKTYISARSIVNVEQTDALTGSVNYENGAPAGLTEFEDGAAIDENGEPDFTRKMFKIKHFGKLIPISRILLGAEKAGLLGYINRWFIKNAVISENSKIFGALKAGYNEGTPKAIAGWKALKKSITVDLDPSCKINGLIVTNQSGFAALDEEEDNDGRPVLQPNPANPTEKLFQGLVVHVFPDAQLPNIDATHFPVIYGDTKAGATFVEHRALEFATSEHYGFGKNQNYMRVIEGFDVMSTDTSAYIYGSFTATTKA
jgi:HK97 family phage major capsid protein